MIKAIAIDDELPALKVIENFSGRLDFVQLERCFLKTGEAMKYLQDHPVDLLFLDIQMPSLSGIDFYQAVRPQNIASSAKSLLETGPLVIFTTAYSEYAVEGFNLNAVDYLLKPFTEARFQQAVFKVRDIISRRQTDGVEEFIFLRIDYSMVKAAIADILLVEGMDDYLRIHLRDKSSLLVRMTMKAILTQLPAGRFMRVHRSYIINIAAILNVRNKVIYLDGKEVPIGVSYEKDFFARFPIRR